MKSKTATWFVCGIRYDKTMEDGNTKRVTEQYVIDALSFTEAEERITEEMSSYMKEFDIKTCAFAPFREVFFSDNADADKWYKVKIDLISHDEKTEKIKLSHVTYLIQAVTIDGALKNMRTIMNGTMLDYMIMSISETNYQDVFEYKEKNADDGESEATS